MTEMVGREFDTFAKGVLDGEIWVVTVTLLEVLKLDDGQELKESIEVIVRDSDFNTANQIALASALRQLQEEVYDKGFVSLVEAREVVKWDVANQTNTTTLAQ